MSLSKAYAIVLYAPVLDADISVPLHPIDRYNEVIGCQNQRARIEKYLVWKLFEKAVTKYLKLDFANQEFTKTENGQWLSPGLCFSLSHTDGLVCVAVSDAPIGVDAELVRGIRPELDVRILTERELGAVRGMAKEDKERFLLEAWVKKESIFKKSGGKALLPNRIELDAHSVLTERVVCQGREYIIAVCQDRNIEIEFYFTEEI